MARPSISSCRIYQGKAECGDGGVGQKESAVHEHGCLHCARPETTVSLGIAQPYAFPSFRDVITITDVRFSPREPGGPLGTRRLKSRGAMAISAVGWAERNDHRGRGYPRDAGTAAEEPDASALYALYVYIPASERLVFR